ncbi:hypothetical protein Tco_0595696 [Tanacetum coccineum]
MLSVHLVVAFRWLPAFLKLSYMHELVVESYSNYLGLLFGKKLAGGILCLQEPLGTSTVVGVYKDLENALRKGITIWFVSLYRKNRDHHYALSSVASSGGRSIEPALPLMLLCIWTVSCGSYLGLS